MVRRRGAWVAAGVTGLLIAGGATVGIASASSAAAGAPRAAQHWRIVFKAPKVSPLNQSTQEFTAVVATGKTTGFAFNGFGAPGGESAYERTPTTWKKVPFPGKNNEHVATAGASSPSNVWAFADSLFSNSSRVLRWTGSKWVVVPTPAAMRAGNIWGASVLGPKDVWVYGLTAGGFQARAIGVWHFNGNGWTRIGKNISGGSALSDHDVWGFTRTSVVHWAGHGWTATSVKGLLPAVDPHGLNHPSLEGVLALSDRNVYAFGSANTQDEGGPLVVLHFDGHKWSNAATGQFGYGPAFQQFSSDGRGGLWIPMNGPAGGTSVLVHYASGKLTVPVMPVNPVNITVTSISRIPGTTQQLGGGSTHAPGRGANVDAVLLQYS